TGNPIGDQVWAAFQGRLGGSQDNAFVGATYFDGSNLSAADLLFVAVTVVGANALKKLDDMTHGDGPEGPGGREWVKPVSGKLFNNSLMVLQANDNMGQGPGAV